MDGAQNTASQASQADAADQGNQGNQGAAGAAGADLGSGQPAGNGGQGNEGKDGRQAEGGENGAGKDGAGQGATGWEGLAAHIPPDSGIDPELVSDFGKRAQAAGLKPEQAKDLIDWQLEAVKKAQARAVEAGMASLKKEWGADTDKNLRQALETVTFIDRKLGSDSFSKAIGKYGVACDADFVRGLHAIAGLIAEDSLGQKADQAGAVTQETALDGLKDLFK